MSYPSLFAGLCSALLLLGANRDDVQHLTIPGQKVAVALTLPGFKAEPPDDPTNTLLFGTFADGVVVSLLFEENFPFLSGEERVRRRAKESKFKGFASGTIAGCEFTSEVRNKLATKHYHAYPTTEDTSFDLHVSVTTLGKLPGAKFEREDFLALVQSFRVEGRIDASGLPLPPEVYALRDEAAHSGGDGLTWTKKRCLDAPDDWAASFYLGALAYERRDDELSAKGNGRAAQLLAALTERTPKQTVALVRACDAAAAACAARKRFAEAAPWCELLLSATKPDAPEDISKFRHEAQFNLACCYAMSRRPEEALEALRALLAAVPAFRERLESELLDPLRGRADFKKLVESAK